VENTALQIEVILDETLKGKDKVSWASKPNNGSFEMELIPVSVALST
jgi:hypothetical protein